MIRVKAAARENYQGFLELAREVEPLFGPMADESGFQEALKEALAGGAVFVAAGGDASAPLRGAVVIDRCANCIAWLAVSRKHRGKGLGAMLLRHAIRSLDPERAIRVTTFAGRTGEAAPARNLYESNGFVETEPGGLNPAGIDTVVMEYKAGQRF
ncbi:MAG: GNAT family N-acetyltransferase [Thermodesulfobacteriota bacterium]